MLERFSGAEFLDRPTEHGGDAEIDDQRCGTEPGEGSEVSMLRHKERNNCARA